MAHRLLPRPEFISVLAFSSGLQPLWTFSRRKYTRICVHLSPPKRFFSRGWIGKWQEVLSAIAPPASSTPRFVKRWTMSSSGGGNGASRSVRKGCLLLSACRAAQPGHISFAFPVRLGLRHHIARPL